MRVVVSSFHTLFCHIDRKFEKFEKYSLQVTVCGAVCHWNYCKRLHQPVNRAMKCRDYGIHCEKSIADALCKVFLSFLLPYPISHDFRKFFLFFNFKVFWLFVLCYWCHFNAIDSESSDTFHYARRTHSNLLFREGIGRASARPSSRLVRRERWHKCDRKLGKVRRRESRRILLLFAQTQRRQRRWLLFCLFSSNTDFCILNRYLKVIFFLGFGTLLKSFRINKSSNQLMCRDLSGRRLADVEVRWDSGATIFAFIVYRMAQWKRKL